jgi:hypothetical protein
MPGIPAFPAFMELTTTGPNVALGRTIWSGNEMIEYTVSGSFGLTLDFFNYTTCCNGGNLTVSNLIGQFHTNPVFSIASQDSFVLKRSQSLTMTLTFLLLLFVVLDFIRVEKERQYSKK